MAPRLSGELVRLRVMPTQSPSAAGRRLAWWARALTLTASALIVAGGYVHFCLYRHGYRSIPTIGPAFLLQVSWSAAITIALVVARGTVRTGRHGISIPQLARLAGIGLALGTLVALAIAHTSGGLFGFREFGLRPAPQTVIAVLVEYDAAVLLTIAMLCGWVAERRVEARAHPAGARGFPTRRDACAAGGPDHDDPARRLQMEAHDEPTLSSGVQVQVWGSLTGRWVRGYQIVAASPRGYIVRRVSDRVVLRQLFGEHEVRVEPVPLPPRTSTPGSAA
jgi:hypothetical protein